MRICLRGCARAMCIPILTSATVKPARPSLARRVPVVPGRPCPSRPSRRRVRRARRACRHCRPRRARRPRPAHGDPHSSREPPGPTDVAISAGTPRTPSSGFRDPEMSRMCRGPTVDSKNAGIHTRTPGRRGERERERERERALLGTISITGWSRARPADRRCLALCGLD
jgi:hypothetical protein